MPRLAASLMKSRSCTSRTAIAGQVASCTIRSIGCKAFAGSLVDDRHRYVRPLGRGDTCDVRERGLSSDDIVPQLRHREGDLVQADSWAIGNQDPEAGRALGIHLRVAARRASEPMVHRPRCSQTREGVGWRQPNPR